MHLMEDDVLRDMIFEMNGMRFYCIYYPFVEERKKRERKKYELLSERNIALPCWIVTTDYL